MSSRLWQNWRSHLLLPTMRSLDPRQQEWRIYVFERDIGLAVKAVVVATLFYYFYWSNWMVESPIRSSLPAEEPIWTEARHLIQYAFMGYLAVNIGLAFILLGMRQTTLPVVQGAVFTVALVDAAFLGSLLVITGGMTSPLYWLYLLLIMRNCISLATNLLQITANVLSCGSFVVATVLEQAIRQMDAAAAKPQALPSIAVLLSGENLGLQFQLRLLLLAIFAIWCYSLQLLWDRQRRQVQEQHELALRRAQFEVSSRLAAEIAHQLKNPLAIINNASFTLQRTVKEGKTITQQIQIIREEVARSDQLITELMGYAKMAEGRVEKLDLKEEVEKALLEVFPPAVKYDVTIHREYAAALPDLLVQRNHISEVLVNVLQNAREAMGGRGNLWVSVQHGPNRSVLLTLTDDGPGIPPEKIQHIFEPYFTTREQGSGLGLAIVKHNIEMYGGKISVESELGHGARFIIEWPAKTLMRLRR